MPGESKETIIFQELGYRCNSIPLKLRQHSTPAIKILFRLILPLMLIFRTLQRLVRQMQLFLTTGSPPNAVSRRRTSEPSNDEVNSCRVMLIRELTWVDGWPQLLRQ